MVTKLGGKRLSGQAKLESRFTCLAAVIFLLLEFVEETHGGR